MLVPNKMKYRKHFKGRIHGKASKGHYVAYGEYGLVSLAPERITARQIEAARQAMTRYTKRGGAVWIRIFPHTPVTKKPADVKMGGGKGGLEYYAARVKPGTVMFEIAGVTEEQAREAMRLAAHKMPVKCKVIKRVLTDEQRADMASAIETAREHQAEMDVQAASEATVVAPVEGTAPADAAKTESKEA
jgi:large subunit ribosomal protein L16